MQKKNMEEKKNEQEMQTQPKPETEKKSEISKPQAQKTQPKKEEPKAKAQPKSQEKSQETETKKEESKLQPKPTEAKKEEQKTQAQPKPEVEKKPEVPKPQTNKEETAKTPQEEPRPQQTPHNENKPKPADEKKEKPKTPDQPQPKQEAVKNPKEPKPQAQDKKADAPSLEDDRPLRFGPIRHVPLISVIAVNYNGERELPSFLLSLSRQSYRNFELILVDNASTDRSIEIAEEYRHLFKSMKILQTGSNLGFAAGNNYALPYAKGEFLALVNVDTRLDEDWMSELFSALANDPSAAASTSKTLFYEQFQDLTLIFDEPFTMSRETLLKSLSYKKIFIRKGRREGETIHSDENRIVISIPVQKSPIDISLERGGIKKSFITVKRGRLLPKKYIFDRESLNLKIDFSLDSLGYSEWIINNAGSVTINGMPGDRGLGNYDRGQFEQKIHVDFFCGVSVLLRRSAIIDRDIFVPEFFAYYEDSELSRWIRRTKNLRIVYNPKAKLWHRHSSTSSEGSPLWNLLVTRSREIYRYDGKEPHKLIGGIRHLEWYFSPRVNSDIINALGRFTDSLEHRIRDGIVPKRKAIGIFNRYWNTKGGGESHALSIAAGLQKEATVYLISDEDFDIEELERYYHIDLSNCRKLIETKISPKFTEQFDIFINSTFHSNLPSRAKESYYIVSFPHKVIHEDVKSSYTFLYNSDYTAKWARRYWGEVDREEILYPIGSIDRISVNEIDHMKKDKIILTVGRFFRGGHSKNQHITAKAFRQFVHRYGDNGWKLVLIGSLNENVNDDLNYFHEVEKELEGLNYEIYPNADRSILKKFYSKAYLYIHSSGMGRDTEKEPDRIEHFGITPVEAMAKGCYPVTYHIGGPAELLKKLNIGRRFSNIAELVEILGELTSKYPQAIGKEIAQKTENFLKEQDISKRIEETILAKRGKK